MKRKVIEPTGIDKFLMITLQLLLFRSLKRFRAVGVIGYSLLLMMCWPMLNGLKAMALEVALD